MENFRKVTKKDFKELYTSGGLLLALNAWGINKANLFDKMKLMWEDLLTWEDVLLWEDLLTWKAFTPTTIFQKVSHVDLKGYNVKVYSRQLEGEIFYFVEYMDGTKVESITVCYFNVKGEGNK